MISSTIFYELLLRGDDAGNLAGMHYQRRTIYRDDSGAVAFERILNPEPVTAGSEHLATILPALNAAAIAQVDMLTAQLATAAAALKASRADVATKAERIAALEAQVTTLTAPAPESDTLAALDAEFVRLIPDKAIRDQFAGAWMLVRLAIQQGYPDQARAIIEHAAVPDNLTDAKARLLAAIV